MTFVRKGSGVPIGTKIEVFSKDVPKGYLLCDGSRVLKAQYAKLYNVIGDTFIRLTNEFGDVLTQDPLKFWLPEFSTAVFVANGRKKYAALYNYLIGSPSEITTTYTTRYIASVRRIFSSHTYATTLVHATKTTGKHFFTVRLKDVVFNTSELGQIMLECVGGAFGNEGYQVGLEFVKSGANTVFSNCKVYSSNAVIQNLSALSGLVVNRQEVTFYVDLDNKTGGIVVGGVNYNLVALPVVAAYDLRTSLYKNGASASLEVGYLPASEMMYSVPVGYQHLFELAVPEFIHNEKSGQSDHAHTVGGTALTIGQLPAHSHASGGGGSFSAGGGGFGMQITATGSPLPDTGSVGSGETHAHALTTTSNLPPYVTAMFAIKYK